MAKATLAIASNRMDQHRSVPGADVHAGIVRGDEAGRANEVAQQGAVAKVRHVGREARVSVAVAAGHLESILWVCGADILHAVHQQSLQERGVLRVLWVGHQLQEDSLLAADVRGVQEGEVEAGEVHRVAASRFRGLARCVVVGLLTHAVGIPKTGLARLWLTILEVDRVTGEGEVANGGFGREPPTERIVAHGHASCPAVLAPVAAGTARELRRVQIDKRDAVLAVVGQLSDALVVGDHGRVSAGIVRNALRIPGAAKRPEELTAWLGDGGAWWGRASWGRQRGTVFHAEVAELLPELRLCICREEVGVTLRVDELCRELLSAADALLRGVAAPNLDHDVVEVGVRREGQVPLASIEGLGVDLDAHAAVLAHDDDAGRRVRRVALQDLQRCGLYVGGADHVLVPNPLHDVLVPAIDSDGIGNGRAETSEEVLAEEGLHLDRTSAGLRRGQAPNALRLEVEAVLVSLPPAVLHVGVTRDGAVVEAWRRPIVIWDVLALVAVALLAQGRDDPGPQEERAKQERHDHCKMSNNHLSQLCGHLMTDHELLLDSQQ